MNFIVRAVRHDDLNQLFDLAKQFNLLNLPGDRRVLSAKVDRSEQSFAGKLSRNDAEYVFVLEDLEEKLIVGSSLVLAKHGNEEVPHSFFEIYKKDHFSEDLGVGFIHQVLRFKTDYDGPTEVGGLLVDKTYRRRPEKLGKQISLARFLYMGIHPEQFETRILCELTPPLTDEGRSEFWEALGRRFTGLPYQEADLLSQSHKEFIESLFPTGEIYTSLLDAKARAVLGRVGEATKPAQHLLESIGFEYLDEVDPFDGGPHYGADLKEIGPVKQGRRLKVAEFKDAAFKDPHLVATTQEDFRASLSPVDIRGGEIALPAKIRQNLNIELNDEIYVAPFNYGNKRE